MKHKQYEQWILNEEIELTPDQKKELADHLAECSACQSLQIGWAATKELLQKAPIIQPTPGFSARWEKTLERKMRAENIRRYRLTWLAVLLLASIVILAYLLISGSFTLLLANSFNALSRLIFGITEGLSNFGYWMRKLPLLVPLSTGFILFGLMTAFLTVGLMVYLDFKNRRMLPDEIRA